MPNRDRARAADIADYRFFDDDFARAFGFEPDFFFAALPSRRPCPRLSSRLSPAPRRAPWPSLLPRLSSSRRSGCCCLLLRRFVSRLEARFFFASLLIDLLLLLALAGELLRFGLGLLVESRLLARATRGILLLEHESRARFLLRCASRRAWLTFHSWKTLRPNGQFLDAADTPGRSASSGDTSDRRLRRIRS
jgi:hypothetical protein